MTQKTDHIVLQKRRKRSTNFKNLMLTNPGERVMLPNFGAGIRQLLLRQTEALFDKVRARIFGQVRTFMPFVTIEYLCKQPE